MADEGVSRFGVVAIGRNEGERLKRCLRSIPSAIPVAYVDSASTDDSVAFASSVGALVVSLDMRLPFSAARARNEGFDALYAAHPDIEYVQFVDGDCELEAGWLETAELFLAREPDVAATCGRRRERFPEASFYNGMADEEWNTPTGEARACGGDAMMRIAAFVDAKGYDPAMIAGEEPELCQRMRARGWRIWRLDAPMTIHDADMHFLRQWWMRAVRSGFGYAQVWRKTKRSGGDVLYGRQIISAFSWTVGIIGLAGLLALAFGPLAILVAPLLWSAQLGRLARREGAKKAMLLMLGKFAEMLGILRFQFASIAGRRQGAIFYK
ncbi:glycosyltransferase [Sphingopyxis sp.]|uniref:glycosyltransferase n=1 Tax=Sphingopyxis sp. TaxID=1908224 RepID=UPI003BAA54AE